MESKRDSFFKKTEKKELNNDNKNKAMKQNGSQEFKERHSEKFMKNRVAPDDNEGKEKKPFDKKAYRIKKYSKKYKLEQWEEQRKKRLFRNYYKEVKNEQTPGTYKPKSFDGDTTDLNQEVGRFVRHPDLLEKENNQLQKKDPFLKAKQQYEKIKEEKQKKKDEIGKAKEERKKKLEEYKKKKQERFKKLSKKTKKGQPVMTGRLEMLLEKIQGSK